MKFKIFILFIILFSFLGCTDSMPETEDSKKIDSLVSQVNELNNRVDELEKEIELTNQYRTLLKEYIESYFDCIIEERISISQIEDEVRLFKKYSNHISNNEEIESYQLGNVTDTNEGIESYLKEKIALLKRNCSVMEENYYENYEYLQSNNNSTK